MIQRILPTVILAAAFVLGHAGSARADIISTLPEYNGTPSFDFNPADYPLVPVNIGDFLFTIPAGYYVVGGTISGTFGNTDVAPFTAPSDFYLDGVKVEVAECDDALTGTAACDSGSVPTAWSYTLTSQDLSNLASEFTSGSIDFNVIQNGPIALQTSVTTLDLVAAPEPASVFVFCGGLAGIGLLRRFRKA
jgi:hypothetical protein